MTYKKMTLENPLGYKFWVEDAGDDELLIVGMASQDGDIGLALTRQEAEEFASLILSAFKHIKYRKDDTTGN